jgi:hypothetical protein
MSTSLWQDSLDDQVLDELQRLMLIVGALPVAQRLWDRVLTDNQRRRLGESLPDAWTNLGTVGIWMRLYEVSQPRAIIEIAQKTGFIDEPTVQWLLREIGDRAAEKNSEERPSWQVETGQLRWGGRTVRRVRVMQSPTNLQRILDAFETAGWPPEIPNPLGADASQATHQALYDLNHDLQGVRFHSKEGALTLYWMPSRKAESRPSHPK